MSLRATMTGAAAALVAAVALAACGGSSAPHVPNLAKLPLPPGARTVWRATDCDPGADAYCGVQLVVYDRDYRSSDDLMHAQRDLLHKHGWTDVNALVGPETAADSPGHKLHLTYATAGDELSVIEFKWVKRSKAMQHVLSQSIFDGTPALGMLLEFDSGAT